MGPHGSLLHLLRCNDSIISRETKYGDSHNINWPHTYNQKGQVGNISININQLTKTNNMQERMHQNPSHARMHKQYAKGIGDTDTMHAGLNP